MKKLTRADLPEWHQARERCCKGNPSALDVLISENEPIGGRAADKFRDEVLNALNELLQKTQDQIT